MTSMSRDEALKVLQPDKPDRLGKLQPIDPRRIQPNDLNPRMTFPVEEEKQLLESIDHEGILVPLIVYKERGQFFLLDGERRLRCAKKLGLRTVPAHVLPKPPSDLKNLLTMFHIHHHAESWEPMPRAWSLQKVIDLMGTQDVSQLATATGLAKQTINRSLMLLRAPEDIQEMVYKHALDPSYVYEIEPVLRAYEQRHEEVFRKHGGREGVLRKLLAKAESRVVDTPIAYRKLAKVARGTDLGESEARIREICDRVLDEPDFHPEEAYTVAIEALDVAKTVERRASSLFDLLSDFDPDAETLHTRPGVKESLSKLRDLISAKLDQWTGAKRKSV